jgi:hypothetical protein
MSCIVHRYTHISYIFIRVYGCAQEAAASGGKLMPNKFYVAYYNVDNKYKNIIVITPNKMTKFVFRSRISRELEGICVCDIPLDSHDR